MNDGPYRSSDNDEPVAAPVEGGIVADVIAQFADPLAFYRELVQNAIDAGTPSVDVKIERDESAGLTRVSVKDRGEGMSRDTIENQLLVLFRSTKETDHGKIGKFGIGFASVLSPNPSVVAVNSARDGKRLTLHLSRDLTYRLFDGGPATQTGTTVELDIAMPEDQFASFVERSESALVKWCRHASVPIELATPKRNVRIDRPLDLYKPIVSTTATDGDLAVVVGISADVQPYVGFFNHGLMLYETTRALLGNFAVKIQDSRLGHTLSRDDVRRDAAFDRAMKFAREAIKRDLPVAATRAIEEAIEKDDLETHQKIIEAVVAAKLEHVTIRFPVIGERRAVTLRDLGGTAWATVSGGDLADEVAQSGEIVLRATSLAWLVPKLEELAKCRVRWIEHELTRIVPAAEPSDHDVALHKLVEEAFRVSGREPSKIVFASLEGACRDQLALAGQDRECPYHVDREHAAQSPFGRLRRPTLVISTSHAYVKAARAADDPRLAATHLVRAILLAYHLLDRDRSQRLLDHALDSIGLG